MKFSVVHMGIQITFITGLSFSDTYAQPQNSPQHENGGLERRLELALSQCL
jgi:hypothetical protein